jgi:hypothetical protein
MRLAHPNEFYDIRCPRCNSKLIIEDDDIEDVEILHEEVEVQCLTSTPP